MYIIFLALLFFLPMGGDNTYGFNFYPLQTLYKMYYYPSTIFAVFNIIGNIALLIPLGLLLPLIIKFFNSFIKILTFSLFFATSIEVIQYYFLSGLRTSDIDDILLNVIGICLGYYLLKLIIKNTASS
jgi:glycopeptide antibiotics resistance protein